jgi:hypothetical protein
MSELHTETRTDHVYYFYGRIVSGYGPSMDPHRCGDPTQPCRRTTSTRTVSPWRVESEEVFGNFKEGR